MLDSLAQDVRYALRLCVRAPAFTAIAVFALAIGIGANTAIFTLVDTTLIERLPYPDADRLVAVWEVSARRPNSTNVVGPANFFRWRERASSFEGLAAFADTRINLTGGGEPEELVVQNVTADFFPILGVAPLLGRTFSREETADPKSTATILTYALWQRRFGGDASIVGRTIELNGAPSTVVGIMPADVRLEFEHSLVGKPADLWQPWVLPESWRTPRGRFLSVLGRVKAGVPVAGAQTEMQTIAAALQTEFPAFDTQWSVALVPLRDEIAGDLKPALLLLAGAVAFVLLIACANVANLLLSRAAVRQREIAIRTALGAGRARVVRQLLTESLILALLGGALGLLLAAWGLDALVAGSPIDVTRLGPVALNRTVLAFTAVVSLATAVLAGVAPAFEGTRTDVQDALKEGARHAGGGRAARLRRGFVVAEIALAVVLLVGAGLLLRSFSALQSVPSGLDSGRVLTLRITLAPSKYDAAKSLRFFDQAATRMRMLPGVEAAGAISFLPFAGLGAATDFTIVGQPPPAPGQALGVDVSVCDNGYFQAMRIPLKRGRWFTDREQRERSDVVIVNEEMARRFFAATDPIGQQLVISMTDKNTPTTIIGVVGDAKFASLRNRTFPQSYWPHPQLPYSAMTLTVRTAGDPLRLASAVEREIRALDKDQPVSDVHSMDQWVTKSLAQDRFSSFLLTLFAGIALLLATIGVYGVMSYAVSRRTPEIGIRVALGATARDVIGDVLGEGLRLAALGLAVGLVLAWTTTRVMASLLFGVRPTDAASFLGAAALLAAIATLASLLPAIRASRVSPTVALRDE